MGNPRAIEAVHSRLVDGLTEVTFKPGEMDNDEIQRINVRSCAKTHEPLTRCYRDLELGRPSRLSAECRDRIIDMRDSASRKLTRWLDEHFPDAVLDLRDKAPAELAREPDQAEQRNLADVLDAWRDWLKEMITAGSIVQNEMQKQGFGIQSDPVRLEVVSKIYSKFRLPDGFEVVPSDEWEGPPLLHDSRDRLFVRRNFVERDFVGQSSEVESLDGQIADMLEDLLIKREARADIPLSASGSLREVVRLTLERPGALETISEPTSVQFRTW